MANTIKIRRSATPSAVPTTGQLALGELALNTFDGKLYTKKDNGTASIVELSGGGDVTLAGNNAFTGANTFTNATGQTFRQAATQDGILLRGRAGGTGSYNVEIVPGSLTASRTVTCPNGNVTLTAGTSAVLGTAQTFTADQTIDANVFIGTAGGLLEVGGPLGAASSNGIRALGFIQSDAGFIGGAAEFSDNVILKNQKTLFFYETTANGNNYVALRAASSLAANTTYTLPDAAPGSNGQVLASTTGGTMSWITPSGSGDVVLASNNAFTGANTFTNSTGQTFRQAATQDGILLRGRAGGTNSRTVEIVPASLTASRTLTAPDATTTIVGTDVTQTLTNKTLTDPAIIGTILEDVFTISDGAAFEVDPGNGSIQLITLGASRTPKATNFAAGEAVTLMVNDGSAYALTWTDATWGGSGVVWKTNSGSAPTLNTTGYTVIVLWKVSTQVYGARVGDS